jgi:hypothetical protein
MYHTLMPEPQSFKNHGRFDPPMHFFVMPILLANLIACIVITGGIVLHHEGRMLGLHIWLVVVSLALLVLAVNSRLKDLRVQDRVIRLEERLRYAALLPPEKLAESAALTLQQIVALRFASDSELPALVSRTLKEGLEPKHIKQSIVNWRADTHRV